MRNLVLVLFLVIAIVAALMVLAFLYIDMLVHKGFHYDVFYRDSLYGSVKVDRYVTDSKVVYKARSELPFSYGYPANSGVLLLDKGSKLPVRYTREYLGARGQKKVQLLSQRGEYSDLLLIESPRFFRISGFSTGEKTVVYSPEDIMLLMALMERYNHWKKGTQFFEVMVPLDVPGPPFRTKVGVEYLDDEFIPVMGSRMQVESFRLTSKYLPEVKFVVSKYTRRVLIMKVPERAIKVLLVTAEEGPSKRIDMLMRKMPFARVWPGKRDKRTDDGYTTSDYLKMGKISGKTVNIDGYLPPREIFFRSGKLVLSGSLWVPEGEGPFKPVLIIPDEGPRKTGEKLMSGYLGSFLCRSGYLAMKFDTPGQGKSQGSFYETDDDAKIEHIKSALKYLNGLEPSVKGETVIVAHGRSAYTAIRAAERADTVSGCVLLSPEYDNIYAELIHNRKSEAENVRKYVRREGLDVFGEDFRPRVGELLRQHLTAVDGSKDDFAYFMGTRVPLKEYRSYIGRETYSAISSFDKPLLVISGRDERGFDGRAMDGLWSSLRGTNPHNRFDIHRVVGQYAGEIKKIDDRWEYIPRKPVFNSIRDWIGKLQRVVAVEG